MVNLTLKRAVAIAVLAGASVGAKAAEQSLGTSPSRHADILQRHHRNGRTATLMTYSPLRRMRRTSARVPLS